MQSLQSKLKDQRQVIKTLHSSINVMQEEIKAQTANSENLKASLLQTQAELKETMGKVFGLEYCNL